MSSGIRCPRLWCGLDLIEQHDRQLGRITYRCEGCARNHAGLCRDCPATLDDYRGMRCRRCSKEQKKLRGRENARVYYRDPDLRAKHLRLKKRTYRRHRTKKLAYLADYRKTHPRGPRTAGDRAYMRSWMRHAREDAKWNRRYNRRRRLAAREKRAEKIRQLVATGQWKAKRVTYIRRGKTVTRVELVRVGVAA